MVKSPSHRDHARRSVLAPELLLVLALAFVVIVFSLFGRLSGSDGVQELPSAAMPGAPSAADVSSSLSAVLGPNASVSGLEYLSESDISSLATSQPVIYGNITAPVYRAVVNEGGKTFLILYDFGSGMVLRRFEVIGVQLE